MINNLNDSPNNNSSDIDVFGVVNLQPLVYKIIMNFECLSRETLFVLLLRSYARMRVIQFVMLEDSIRSLKITATKISTPIPPI